MARLYTCCNGLAKLFRQPAIVPLQQHISSSVRSLNTRASVCGVSRLAGLQRQSLSRTIHTSARLYNRSIYEDEEDFTTTRSGNAGKQSSIQQRASFNDSLNDDDGYYDADGPPRQRRHNDRDNRSSHGGGGYGDGGGRGFNQNRGGGMFNDEEYSSRDRGFDMHGFSAGELSGGAVDASKLPPVKKDFFNPTEELSARSAEDNAEYLRQHQITIKGKDIPPPIQQFSDYQFPEMFLKKLQQFDAPTAIQAQGWSIALTGRDIIGVGQTGSGKTLGYLLPGLMHMAHHQAVYQQAGTDRWNAPLGLILAPTRELVQQIIKVAEEFGPSVGVNSVAMFGGSSKNAQLGTIRRRNAQLVVATPGRLLDFIRNGDLTFAQCSYLVLDEADRMLDMGFEPQIRNIIKYSRPERHTLMWSATWPSEVQELANDFLKNPVLLSVGSTELRANPDIEQNIHICAYTDKMNMLEELLQQMQEGDPRAQAMVFCETKRMADKVSYNLGRKNVSAEAIHGDKSQRQRDSVLNAFRRGRISVLVATDVAARGIDIPDLKCVVNYDYPNDSESYVHRIGRTGRCGKPGTAHTFFTHEDAGQARGLVKLLRHAGQQVPQELEAMSSMGGSSKKRGGGYGGNRFGGGGRYNNRGGGGGGYGNRRGGGYGNNSGGRDRDYDQWN